MSLLAAAFAVTMTAVTLGATDPLRVRTTAKSEVIPAAGEDWFAWSKSRTRTRGPFDLYAQRTGGQAFRVSRKAYAGGIDGTTLAYQVIRGSGLGNSDLRLLDLATRRAKRLPSGVNTTRWECCPRISGDWLLFSRARASGTGRQLVLLRNLVTGEQRVLDANQARRGALRAAQLNGSYAVWSRCAPFPQCRIFRYDIGSGSATALPVPAGQIPYAPSVNQFGTVYYAQRGSGCGNSVKLMKQQLFGVPELIASLPRGRDVGVSYAHSPALKPPRELVTTRIYFDQRTCGKQQRWDIYRIDDTERVPQRLPSARRSRPRRTPLRGGRFAGSRGAGSGSRYRSRLARESRDRARGGR